MDSLNFGINESNVIPISGSAFDSAVVKHQFSGPLSGPMWRKVSKLQSAYSDDFNWGIYDQIHSRFVHNPPRGGVTFKTTFKLVNFHSSCSKCHHSFEIDTYGRGCIHDCVFCYAKDQLSSHGYWNRPMPFPIDLSEVRKTFYTVFETDKPNKWRSVLMRRTPLRIGSMSDSFMWMDKKYGITKELLKILSFYNYPNIIFTRSDLIAEDEYLNILKPKLSSIQFSISGDNEVLTKALEPGAPSVKRRLIALKKLRENGFWTTVRINPLFPIFPDGYFTDTENVIKRFGGLENVPRFDLMSWDFLSKLKEAKVPSVLAGFVRLSPAAIKAISKSSGLNFRNFFTPEVQKSLGDKHYSDAEISFYYSRLKEEADKEGIRFSVCYIGNGLKDYYAYKHLWSNKTDCCDALGRVEGFKTTSQSVPWIDRIKHASDRNAAISAMTAEKAADQFEQHSTSTAYSHVNPSDISPLG